MVSLAQWRIALLLPHQILWKCHKREGGRQKRAQMDWRTTEDEP